MTEARIEQTIFEIEKLENKTKVNIELLLNSADEKVRHNLENINQVREAAIRDLRATINQTDAYLENRINQMSLAVMKALTFTEEVTKNTLAEINILEDKLFERR